MVFHASHVSQRSSAAIAAPGAGVAGLAASCAAVYSATGIRIEIWGCKMLVFLSLQDSTARTRVDVPAASQRAIHGASVVGEVFAVLEARWGEDYGGEGEVGSVCDFLSKCLGR